jgi:hypothetical protein
MYDFNDHLKDEQRKAEEERKQRILKDPETGEIVGATRTPFSNKVKELNKKIFAEKFEKNKLDSEHLERQLEEEPKQQMENKNPLRLETAKKGTVANFDASEFSSTAFSSDQTIEALLRLEKQQKRTNLHLEKANFYLRFCAIAAFAIVLYTTINWFTYGHWWFVPMKFTPLN